MKYCRIILFILLHSLSNAQVDYALQWDRKWADTLTPIKVKSDSASCHTSEQTPKIFKKGKITINNWGWVLCLTKENGSKHEFVPVQFSDMGQIGGIKGELRDVTGDTIAELVLTYNDGYTEFHYETGGGWYHDYMVVLDTSDLAVLFSAITKYSYNYTETHYKGEEIAGVNNLTDHVEVSRAESLFELEYVVRYSKNSIELVCMKYRNKGYEYKEFELLNPGKIKYEWKNDKWIKSR